MVSFTLVSSLADVIKCNKKKLLVMKAKTVEENLHDFKIMSQYVKCAMCSLSERDRLKALALLQEFTHHLEHVQEVPQLVRLSFWESAYHVFYFLTKARQLRRDCTGFSAEVKQDLERLICQLKKNAYGDRPN